MKKQSLYKALENQGNDAEDIIDIIEEMTGSVLDGENPDDVLFDYGLEPDYVMDLIEYTELI